MPKKITQNVNKDKFFNDLPKVRPEMSAWKTKFANYFACNLGDIYPIYVDEVLPKEKRAITSGMISHTTTPVAPIFPAIYTETRAFFVPFRLCADLLNGYRTRKSPWVKVFGEDPDSTSAQKVVPLDEQALPEIASVVSDAVSDYCDGADMPDHIFDALDVADQGLGTIASNNLLSVAAYELIYQRHYRNENYESSTESPLYRLLFDAYNNEAEELALDGSFTFEKANREKDYFTGVKPFTQKGDAPIVSVGGNAPVKAVNATLTESIPLEITLADSVSANQRTELMAAGTEALDNDFPVKLIADLSTAQGVSIEELRVLIKTQELLEKDAIWGTRYAESLNAHFGTCPLDETLQDPQELFRTTITSQMQAIFQTSTTENEQTVLGTIGANSTTQAETMLLPMTEFKEHGLLIICACHKLQNVYDARLFKSRFNFKRKRFDFYTPELNDLGYQRVMEQEAINLSDRGYNEAFADYRYKFNRRHGSLNTEFPYWAPAISDTYGSFATLYKEGPEVLDEALSIDSDTAPQFYDAWGFEETNVKPMSLHSIPGMDGVI